MKPTDTPIANPQVVLREDFDDWAVLYHPLAGEATGADPVGLAIWKMMDGQRTLAQVADYIAAQCEEPPESILEDVLTYADDLEKRLLILLDPQIIEHDVSPLPQSPPIEPGSGLPLVDHDEFTLTLADGTCLTLRAGDADSAPVVAFLAEAAQLPPAPTPLPPGARRLLAVLGVGQDDALPLTRTSPHKRPRHVSSVTVTGSDADVVCVLEPKDVKQLRPSRPSEARDQAGLFTLEPVTEEQWFWRQLARISATLCRETLAQGGVMLHGGLAQAPHLGCGDGILLAGRSGVGKSTAARRLPAPWREVSDDVTLVVRDDAGTYWAHPWPTWSRLIGEYKWETGCSWDVHQAIPLRAVFFLEQGEVDRAEPVGRGHAAGMLIELAQQTSHSLQRDMDLNEIEAFNLRRFENLCSLAKSIPAYELHATLRGAFWEEIERVLLHPPEVG